MALVGCRIQPAPGSITLSYSEANSFCIACPSFEVDLRAGAAVHYSCRRGCAVPGDYDYNIPEKEFAGMLASFRRVRFFEISRTDGKPFITDAPVRRLIYRDARRIHEVVDVERQLPQITDLENRMKAATEVERYQEPSVALYKRLVATGWDVNTVGADQQNALTSAAVLQDLESVGFLLQHGSRVTDLALGFAASGNNVAMLNQLLSAANIRPADGMFGAMVVNAAGNPKPDALRFLLDSGGDANTLDSRLGRTPLSSAVQSGSLEAEQLLLSRGAGVNVRDYQGRTPLWYAATAGNTGAITLLLEHGADVNARDNEGRTALMQASDLCYTWNIRTLIDAGANPTIKDSHGRTALQPNLVAPGDPKCGDAMKMLEAASNSWNAQRAMPARGH